MPFALHGSRHKPIAPVSPWQNALLKRLIESIRRECIYHLIALGEAHLRWILQSCTPHYNDENHQDERAEMSPAFASICC